MAFDLASTQTALAAINPAVVVTANATAASATVGRTTYSIDLLDGDGNDRSADVPAILANLLTVGP